MTLDFTNYMYMIYIRNCNNLWLYVNIRLVVNLNSSEHSDFNGLELCRLTPLSTIYQINFAVMNLLSTNQNNNRGHDRRNYHLNKMIQAIFFPFVGPLIISILGFKNIWVHFPFTSPSFPLETPFVNRLSTSKAMLYWFYSVKSAGCS